MTIYKNKRTNNEIKQPGKSSLGGIMSQFTEIVTF